MGRQAFRISSVRESVYFKKYFGGPFQKKGGGGHFSEKWDLTNILTVPNAENDDINFGFNF